MTAGTSMTSSAMSDIPGIYEGFWPRPRFTANITDQRIQFLSGAEPTETELPIETLPSEASEETEPMTEALPLALEDNWMALALSGLSERSYERIQLLATKPEGWRGAAAKTLQPSSLRDFLKFWNAVQPLALEPEFALTPRGHIQAEWHRSTKQHLELEFAGNDKIFYGLFDKKSVHEGLGAVQELRNMLQDRHSKPLRWTLRS